jgi:hypothetical protein
MSKEETTLIHKLSDETQRLRVALNEPDKGHWNETQLAFILGSAQARADNIRATAASLLALTDEKTLTK